MADPSPALSNSASATNTKAEAEKPNKKKKSKTSCWFFVCLVCFQALCLALLCGLVILLVIFVISPAHPQQTVENNGGNGKNVQFNFTACMLGWDVDNDDDAGFTCSSLSNNETKCESSISCCYYNKSTPETSNSPVCGPFNNTGECVDMNTRLSCESNSLYCIWKFNVNKCLPAMREKELLFFDQCKRLWPNSTSLAANLFVSGDCNKMTNASTCASQIGCCWKKNRCVTYRYEMECSNLKTLTQCNDPEDFIPNRCTWSNMTMKCNRTKIVVLPPSDAITSPPSPFTRFPTIQATRKPTSKAPTTAAG
jgi:hypothetical protein